MLEDKSLIRGRGNVWGISGSHSLHLYRKTVDPKLQGFFFSFNELFNDVKVEFMSYAVQQDRLSSCPREPVPTDKRILWPVNVKKCFHCSLAKSPFIELPKILPQKRLRYIEVFLKVMCVH